MKGWCYFKSIDLNSFLSYTRFICGAARRARRGVGGAVALGARRLHHPGSATPLGAGCGANTSGELQLRGSCGGDRGEPGAPRAGRGVFLAEGLRSRALAWSRLPKGGRCRRWGPRRPAAGLSRSCRNPAPGALQNGALVGKQVEIPYIKFRPGPRGLSFWREPGRPFPGTHLDLGLGVVSLPAAPRAALFGWQTEMGNGNTELFADAGVRGGGGPAHSSGVQPSPPTPGPGRQKQRAGKGGSCPSAHSTAGVGWGTGGPAVRLALQRRALGRHTSRERWAGEHSRHGSFSVAAPRTPRGLGPGTALGQRDP